MIWGGAWGRLLIYYCLTDLVVFNKCCRQLALLLKCWQKFEDVSSWVAITHSLLWSGIAVGSGCVLLQVMNVYVLSHATVVMCSYGTLVYSPTTMSILY